MTLRRLFSREVLIGLTTALAVVMGAAAQPAQGPMMGLNANRDQPLKIESSTLEVRDKSGRATFSGDVKLTQGDTIIQCKVMVVFYEDAPVPAASKKGGPPAQKSAGPGGQQIKRVEAKGDVLMTQKDQTAKGDSGVWEVKTNSVTLIGNVVVTQGTNVVRGDRMYVDLNTGVSRVESDKTKRVEGLFNPSAPPKSSSAPAAAPAPAQAKPGPGAPTRLN